MLLEIQAEWTDKATTGKPYIALVTFHGGRAEHKWGRYDDEKKALLLEASPGDIVMTGQKDLVNNLSPAVYRHLYPDGKLGRNLSIKEAAKVSGRVPKTGEELLALDAKEEERRKSRELIERLQREADERKLKAAQAADNQTDPLFMERVRGLLSRLGIKTEVTGDGPEHVKIRIGARHVDKLLSLARLL
jgi:hypothetical protein